MRINERVLRELRQVGRVRKRPQKSDKLEVITTILFT